MPSPFPLQMDKQGGPVVADIQTNGQLPIISTKHVCLHFRLPFWTTWGQSLVVSGDGKVLGDWDPLQGLRMSCHHAGEELIWEAQVSVPHVRQFSYRWDPNQLRVLGARRQSDEWQKVAVRNKESDCDGDLVAEGKGDWEDGEANGGLMQRKGRTGLDVGSDTGDSGIGRRAWTQIIRKGDQGGAKVGGEIGQERELPG